MVSDEQVITSVRRIPRFRKGLAGRRSLGGCALAATPIVLWTVRARDSAGGSRVYVGRAPAPASTRMLAASLWRLAATTDGSGSVTWRRGRFYRLFEFNSSSSIPKFGSEEGTKWDYCCLNTALGGVNYRCRHAAVFKTKKCMNECKAEGELRRRINYCMKKLNEERALQRRTDHHNMRLIVRNLVDNIKSERRKCKKLDIVNSKLVSDIVEAKLSASKFHQNLEKEKKVRAQLENKCDQLAKCIEGSRAEIGALRNQRARIHDEMEEERKMLQMAEVWKEERVQMKLVDAKVILEDKLSKINNLIVDCEAIMRPSNSTAHVNLTSNVKGRRVADHGFNHNQGHYTSSARCNNTHVVSENIPSKSMRSNGLTSQNGLEDGSSCKETVTQADINSSQTLGDCTGEGLRNKIRSGINISNCNAECRKKALGASRRRRSQSSEISSVSFVQPGNISSSVCKPRKEEACKTIQINESERLSNRSISMSTHQLSPQRVLGKEEYSSCYLASRLGSTNQRRNPHVIPSKRGHVISPQRMQRHVVSAPNLPEAKLVSKKMLIRDVLDQRS